MPGSEEDEVPAYVVTIEVDPVTMDSSNLTLSEA